MDTVFRIGVAPVRIDILTGIDGVRFDDAWPRRLTADLAWIETRLAEADGST